VEIESPVSSLSNRVSFQDNILIVGPGFVLLVTLDSTMTTTRDQGLRHAVYCLAFSFFTPLAWRLQQELDESTRANCYYLYLNCLNVALGNGEVNLAMQG
jgi:hypothetical protein